MLQKKLDSKESKNLLMGGELIHIIARITVVKVQFPELKCLESALVHMSHLQLPLERQYDISDNSLC